MVQLINGKMDGITRSRWHRFSRFCLLCVSGLLDNFGVKLMKISEEVLCLNDELIALRRDFHQHPEIGGQEFRTAEVVEKYLQDLGLETKRMADTGVVATLYGNRPNGKTILLRADMDALLVEEENEVPYKSVNPGVMHACGHDGHTAMLLVAAKVLCARKDELKGNVKFVFQPNEEVGAAHLMVRDGVLQNPSVDASFGLHLWSPIKSGVIGIKSGSVMAEMYNFKITLVGKDGHTSAPEASIDPIIHTDAPPANAFTISPEYLSPPSAITGIPYFLPSSAQSITAVNCGTPTPATILVVQIEPGPIPTFTQSAPASIKSLVASAVATLPAIT